MSIIVQLTDPHIRVPKQLAYGRIDTAPYLRAGVASIKALRQRPHAVVITGDLTDFGRAIEYAHFKELLSPLDIPVYLLPGNHDDRQTLRDSFPEHTYLGQGPFIQYAVDIGPVRVVAIDTCIAGESGGSLCTERLDWLDAMLQKSQDRPVIIAMHHPPFRTLIGHMDDIGLIAGGDVLEAIVSKYKNVERIICGHLHRAIDARFGGTIASTSPAPAHQVTLDLDDAAASTWMLEPPSFRVHAWDARSRRLVTHLAPIGQFEGPYPFHDNGALID
ncbi:phosphodiesterase [Pollutimonas subterranea]|uniref:Phosphodiesterase n=1 Tax=Pollutimonas subterranea TaxID=2045210 RepID=A0A2N4U3T3_9BURK|nr:phosphodiesterase [Pollutimonas subterranea]PLC49676.1 phosphodiesterase [Pollutimonas subterranea]